MNRVPLPLSPLTAISPIDGRYAPIGASLRGIWSEYGLMRHRVKTEVLWLLTLANHKDITEIPSISADAQATLRGYYEHFDLDDATAIKTLEQSTHHDVKAVEYWIKGRCEADEELKPLTPFIHFACTSEDINNIAYALMVKDTMDQFMLPQMRQIMDTLNTMATALDTQPMLSRTHGQPASPTTLGKELRNVIARLASQYHILEHTENRAKINGAVGNFNAHKVAYPEIHWPELAKTFIEQLHLSHNPWTTQIEPHDGLAEYMHALCRFNTILIDFCRDIWGYIALDYFKQRTTPEQVGSSTMPHKINPIDFENAEGNLGFSHALCAYFAQKLPISRWQRDLTDSTTLRNLGLAFAHSLLAYQALLKGLSKLEVHAAALDQDLDQHWEVLGEAIQTVMRRYGVPEPYEQVRLLTQGKTMNQERLHAFIDGLDIPQSVKARLKTLKPSTYTGYA